MRDADFDAELVRQFLEFLFEHVPRRAVAATAVAQHQEFLGLRVVRPPVLFPPRRDAVTGQFTGVVAGVQVEKALVAPTSYTPCGITTPDPALPKS